MKLLLSSFVIVALMTTNVWAFSSDFVKNPVQDAIESSSTVYRYTSKDNFQKMSRELSRNSKVLKGRQLIIDTRDQEQCLEIQRQLNQTGARPNSNSQSNLCSTDPKFPFVSLTVYEEVRDEDFQKEIDLSPIKSTDRNTLNETRNLTIGAFGVAGILYLLPESITKWDKSKSKDSVLKKYRENVRHGPVRDQDDWFINYIGHPISGAAYYQVARNLNLSHFESFGYTVMMSTFFWEYGIEALAEVPSIQDLWITPIVGSLLGELFFQLEQKIKSNGGTVLGSAKLGSLVMILLNPAGSLSNKINSVLGSKVIQESRLYVGSPSTNKSSLGLRLEFRF